MINEREEKTLTYDHYLAMNNFIIIGIEFSLAQSMLVKVSRSIISLSIPKDADEISVAKNDVSSVFAN